jgi:hypothetical protein
MKRTLVFLSCLFVSFVGALVYAATTDNVRFSSNMHEAFLQTNGSPVHRFTATPDATTAESNLTATGGTAVAYTLVGGERLCFQTPEAAYIQVIAAASMTAAGALGFRVGANEPLLSNCITLKASGQLSVSALCVTGSCTGVKAFELQ